MRPVIAMVTDRSRLGEHWQSATALRVAAAARVGVHLVLVRERGLDARPLAALVTACLAAVSGTRTRVLVNERVDVALATGAHGVHLRGDSVRAGRVRAIAPASFLIGRSVHNRDEVERVDDDALDYLLFGNVFETASKPGVPAAGTSRLADIAASTQLPVLAVGGMTAETVRGLGATGAAGFAAIGLFCDTPLDRLHALVRQAAIGFGTAPPA